MTTLSVAVASSLAGTIVIVLLLIIALKTRSDYSKNAVALYQNTRALPDSPSPTSSQEQANDLNGDSSQFDDVMNTKNPVFGQSGPEMLAFGVSSGTENTLDHNIEIVMDTENPVYGIAVPEMENPGMRSGTDNSLDQGVANIMDTENPAYGCVGPEMTNSGMSSVGASFSNRSFEDVMNTDNPAYGCINPKTSMNSGISSRGENISNQNTTDARLFQSTSYLESADSVTNARADLANQPSQLRSDGGNHSTPPERNFPDIMDTDNPAYVMRENILAFPDVMDTVNPLYGLVSVPNLQVAEASSDDSEEDDNSSANAGEANQLVGSSGDASINGAGVGVVRGTHNPDRPTELENGQGRVNLNTHDQSEAGSGLGPASTAAENEEYQLMKNKQDASALADSAGGEYVQIFEAAFQPVASSVSSGNGQVEKVKADERSAPAKEEYTRVSVGHGTTMQAPVGDPKWNGIGGSWTSVDGGSHEQSREGSGSAEDGELAACVK